MTRERNDLKPLVGKKLTVIAWLWARTVKSPNPAFHHIDVPLISTFVISRNDGKQAYLEPAVDGESYRFVVKMGRPPREAEQGTKASGRGASFRCLVSNTPIDPDYIRREGQMKRIGARLMAVVSEGDRSRVYLSPTTEMEAVARKAEPGWKPDVQFFEHALGFRVGNYGMDR
jgi:putative DNA methylase